MHTHCLEKPVLKMCMKIMEFLIDLVFSAKLVDYDVEFAEVIGKRNKIPFFLFYFSLL